MSAVAGASTDHHPTQVAYAGDETNSFLSSSSCSMSLSEKNEGIQIRQQAVFSADIHLAAFTPQHGFVRA
jgi:hypothetical protein